jgi:FkbM family methyltransferase
MTNEELNKIIEVRVSPELPDVDPLFWPKYDRGTWNAMHHSPVTPEFLKTLMEHIPNRNIMIQAGGNCGQYVREYAKWFNTVYTFEPDPINFLCLTLNCPRNVIKTQACLGREKIFIELAGHISADGLEAGGMHVGQKGNIPTVRIDDLNLPGCDLIQLDIEGCEYFALQGAVDTIERYHPVIIVEWFDAWSARYGVDKTMFDQFLSDQGYQEIMREHSDTVYKYMP